MRIRRILKFIPSEKSTATASFGHPYIAPIPDSSRGHAHFGYFWWNLSDIERFPLHRTYLTRYTDKSTAHDKFFEITISFCESVILNFSSWDWNWDFIFLLVLKSWFHFWVTLWFLSGLFSLFFGPFDNMQLVCHESKLEPRD